MTFEDEPASLRPATEDDLQQILSIENDSHPQPWTEDHFKKEMEKPHGEVLVLTDDETDSKILGYGVYWVLDEDAHIHNVTVERSSRGLGYGKWIVRSIVSIAQKEGAKSIRLEVRKTNQAAIELYQKAGFAIESVRKAFYSNGDDAYQMIYEVEPAQAF